MSPINPNHRPERCDHCKLALSRKVSNRRKFNFLSQMRVHRGRHRGTVREAFQTIFPVPPPKLLSLQKRNLCSECCSMLARIYHHFQEFKAASKPSSFCFRHYVSTAGSTGELDRSLQGQKKEPVVQIPLGLPSSQIPQGPTVKDLVVDFPQGPTVKDLVVDYDYVQGTETMSVPFTKAKVTPTTTTFSKSPSCVQSKSTNSVAKAKNALQKNTISSKSSIKSRSEKVTEALGRTTKPLSSSSIAQSRSEMQITRAFGRTSKPRLSRSSVKSRIEKIAEALVKTTKPLQITRVDTTPTPGVSSAVKLQRRTACVNCSKLGVEEDSKSISQDRTVTFLRLDQNKIISVATALNFILRLPTEKRLLNQECGSCSDCAYVIHTVFKLRQKLSGLRHVESVVAQILSNPIKSEFNDPLSLHSPVPGNKRSDSGHIQCCNCCTPLLVWRSRNPGVQDDLALNSVRGDGEKVSDVPMVGVQKFLAPGSEVRQEGGCSEFLSIPSALNYIFREALVQEEEDLACCPACSEVILNLYVFHKKLEETSSLDSVIGQLLRVDSNGAELNAEVLHSPSHSLSEELPEVLSEQEEQSYEINRSDSNVEQEGRSPRLKGSSIPTLKGVPVVLDRPPQPLIPSSRSKVLHPKRGSASHKSQTPLEVTRARRLHLSILRASRNPSTYSNIRSGCQSRKERITKALGRTSKPLSSKASTQSQSENISKVLARTRKPIHTTRVDATPISLDPSSDQELTKFPSDLEKPEEHITPSKPLAKVSRSRTLGQRLERWTRLKQEPCASRGKEFWSRRYTGKCSFPDCLQTFRRTTIDMVHKHFINTHQLPNVGYICNICELPKYVLPVAFKNHFMLHDQVVENKSLRTACGLHLDLDSTLQEAKRNASIKTTKKPKRDQAKLSGGPRRMGKASRKPEVGVGSKSKSGGSKKAKQKPSGERRKKIEKPRINHGSCPYCQKVLLSPLKRYRFQHMRLMHKDLPGYPCFICGKPTKNSSCLAIHQRTHLNAEEKKERLPPPRTCLCAQCGKVFGSMMNLRMHEIGFHKKPYISRTGEERKAGLGKRVDYSNKCTTCGKPHRSARLRVAHERSHLSEEERVSLKAEIGHACPDCGSILISEASLKHHRTYVHQISSRGPVWRCPEPNCVYTCMTEETLARHKLRPHDPNTEPRFSCKFCSRSFRVYQELREHKEGACDFDRRRLVCQMGCSRRFRFKSEMLKHYLWAHKRSPEDAYANLYPGLPLPPRFHGWIRNDHKKKRQGFYPQKPLRQKEKVSHPPCPHCGVVLRCRERNGLEIHIRLHHEHVGRLYCSICGKPFNQKQNMEHHMLTHLNKKELEEHDALGTSSLCSECGKSFRNERLLKLHMKYEARVKRSINERSKSRRERKRKRQCRWKRRESRKGLRIPCTEPGCHYSCSTTKYMREHRLRAHDPAASPRWPCPHCSRPFQFHKELKFHLMQVCEAEDRPYACDSCPLRSKYKTGTLSHYILVHKLSPEDAREKVYPGLKCSPSVYRIVNRYENRKQLRRARLAQPQAK